MDGVQSKEQYSERERRRAAVPYVPGVHTASRPGVPTWARLGSTVVVVESLPLIKTDGDKHGEYKIHAVLRQVQVVGRLGLVQGGRGEQERAGRGWMGSRASGC